MKITELLRGLVNLIVGIVVTILGLRFLLRLFNANANNEFVSWIYDSSAEIMGPFRGVFPVSNVEGSVIDFPALFAILVYLLIAFFVVYIINTLDVASKKRK